MPTKHGGFELSILHTFIELEGDAKIILEPQALIFYFSANLNFIFQV